MFFLSKLKDVRMVAFKHIPGPENKADNFTKNADAGMLHMQFHKAAWQ